MDKKYFNPYRWNAQLFTTPEELNSALDVFNIRNKKIIGIRFIGSASIYSEYSVRNQLKRLGVDITQLKNFNFYKLNVPAKFYLESPFIISFEGETNLEIQPYENKGLFMSVNKIDKYIKDGMNLHNCEPHILQCIVGQKLKCIYNKSSTSKSYYTTMASLREEGKGCWSLNFSDNTTLLIYANSLDNGNYWLGICDYAFSFVERPLKEVQVGMSYENQIQISRSYIGACFDIVPVVNTIKERWPGSIDDIALEEKKKYRICIHEEDVEELLKDFLFKYAEAVYPDGTPIEGNGWQSFDWYKANLFTYSTVEEMLEEIEVYSRRLAEDKAVEKNFYERFVCYLRWIMAANPDCKVIKIEGP